MSTNEPVMSDAASTTVVVMVDDTCDADVSGRRPAIMDEKQTVIDDQTPSSLQMFLGVAESAFERLEAETKQVGLPNNEATEPSDWVKAASWSLLNALPGGGSLTAGVDQLEQAKERRSVQHSMDQFQRADQAGVETNRAVLNLATVLAGAVEDIRDNGNISDRRLDDLTDVLAHVIDRQHAMKNHPQAKKLFAITHAQNKRISRNAKAIERVSHNSECSQKEIQDDLNAIHRRLSALESVYDPFDDAPTERVVGNLSIARTIID